MENEHIKCPVKEGMLRPPKKKKHKFSSKLPSGEINSQSLDAAFTNNWHVALQIFSMAVVVD